MIDPEVKMNKDDNKKFKAAYGTAYDSDDEVFMQIFNLVLYSLIPSSGKQLLCLHSHLPLLPAGVPHLSHLHLGLCQGIYGFSNSDSHNLFSDCQGIRESCHFPPWSSSLRRS